MARAFESADLEAVVAIICAWPGDRIGWVEICKASVKVFGFEPTRQALNNSGMVKEAYLIKKAALKNASRCPVRPSSLAVASIRLEILRSENKTLKKQIAGLRDLVDVVLYNAYARGMTEEDMLADLPRVKRERHDQTSPSGGRRNRL
jgi:hypothetical protein